MKIVEIDALTNKLTEREATIEELKQAEKDSADSKTFQDDKLKRNSAKAALLERLGITAEEAALLLS